MAVFRFPVMLALEFFSVACSLGDCAEGPVWKERAAAWFGMAL